MISVDVQIGDGKPGEGSAVGWLLRESLGSRWMQGSIYGHPFGDQHLEHLLQGWGHERSTSIRVATIANDFMAGSTISRGQADTHLDYIAVAPSAKGLGIGSLLLGKVEDSAGSSVTLDVFAENVRAVDWYLNRGYQCFEESALTVFDVTKLQCDRTLSEPAKPPEAEIRKAGFAHTLVNSEAGSVDVLVYGEQRVRIRSHEGMDQLDALRTVNRAFPTRNLICSTAKPSAQARAYLVDELTILRMRKRV